MSRAELAAMAGCSEATIARLERGERPGSHPLQVRLWAIMFSTAGELANLRPLVKALRPRKREADPRQLFLPVAGVA